jgi:tetratricopeptide (TPR) repeat protein
MNFLKNITLDTSPRAVLETIASLREQKGKGEETLALIREAIENGNSYVIQLFWEEFIVYQHLVMTERAKAEEERDENKIRRALLQMDKVVKEARYFIEKYNLKNWRHRLHRFLGRLYDYKGLFKRAVVEYKKAIPLAKDDPEVKEKGYPRGLEVKAFLSYSLIMSGDAKRGMELARRTYRDLASGPDGRYLKRKDYFTWAVWLSGIPIRTTSALIDKRQTFDNQGMLFWLSQAEKVLVIPEGARTWGDKNFQFRKDEIAAIRRRIKAN